MSALRHRLLEAVGVEHGFGVRDAPEPPGVLRPVQVHGAAVWAPDRDAAPAEADAIVCDDPDRPVGIVTADCVPILAASPDGRVVAAIHAGWRGLAAGVVAEGVRALRGLAGPSAAHSLTAVVGPHIGACCYEIDEPVVGPLRERFGASFDDALRRTRPGHWLLDLGQLVDLELERSGVPASGRGRVSDACTFCDAGRFHSYRRDGARAGRLLHYVRAKRSS